MMVISRINFRRIHLRFLPYVNLQRQIQTKVSRPYFVTTPIFYVNGNPHIGHLQSCVYADAFHRIQRLLGNETIFSTGTDEHGLKIQQAAKLAKKEPFEYCSEISKNFKDVFQQSTISFTDFIRTTEDRHITSVHHFWRKLESNNHIYKGRYEGWYDVSNETFVPASQVKEIKDTSVSKMVCSETGHTLELMQEDNYLFTLPKFEKDLLYWLSKDVVKPKMFADDLRRWIGNGLTDLSVSRQRSRLPWGIPVPGDSSQTIYVWLDALVNYLTIGRYPEDNYIWPASCHVIGKDILKFHGIYWPAFLIAADMEPPESLFCHSHWTVDHEKMSKSKGNVIDPLPLMNKYTSDGLRYFLLRAMVPHSDCNYSETKIYRMLNAELADTMGNLLRRCCAPTVNVRQVFPPFCKDAFSALRDSSVDELVNSVIVLPAQVQEQFQDGDFFHGIDAILECLRKTNAFLQVQKPWEFSKLGDPKSQSRLDIILHIAMESLRVCGILLQPVVPGLSKTMLDKLGILPSDRSWTNLRGFDAYNGQSVNVSMDRTLGLDNSVLFERRKVEQL